MDQGFEPQSVKSRLIRAHSLTKGAYDPKSYEFDDRFKPYNPSDPWSVHTTFEMLECLSNNKDIQLDARVLGYQNGWVNRPISRDTFMESFGKKSPWDGQEKHFRESNVFAASNDASFTVGQDFTPLLGGPFYKNLYYYQDYIRMHTEAFYAYHHDPIAKAIVQITRDFVLGDGFEVMCDTKSPRGQLALAVWRAYEEVNDLQVQMDQCCQELAIYGETMWWKLPNNQAKIIYQLKPGDTIPLGIIPRVRIIDPSNIVEVVTYPEDITRPLFFVWLTPTQWQMFTSGIGEGKPKDLGNIQSTLKFIYRTIMADQMMHFKVNSVSNEKRGRSDYFPVLSYMKRLRDVVDFQLIALQKTSAWAIDTTVDGDQSDIDNYVSSQASLGTIAPAGSEFVHSKQITRQYLANTGSSNINSDAFSLALSMIAAGVSIPVSYFGTHLSGGQTRASALVSTEPVAKKMAKRREVMRRVIKMHWKYCMEQAGLPDMDCDIIFPEMITQDRSQKLKDLVLAEQNRWFKPERVATMAAKEFQIHDYNYENELADIKKELPLIPMPLTDEPGVTDTTSESPSSSAITPDERKEIKHAGTHL